MCEREGRVYFYKHPGLVLLPVNFVSLTAFTFVSQFFSDLFPHVCSVKMADEDNLNDQEFDIIITELVHERELGLGDDNQSDISAMSAVSGLHTSELSSGQVTGGFSSSESDVVLSDEEWTDTVEDCDLEVICQLCWTKEATGT